VAAKLVVAAMKIVPALAARQIHSTPRLKGMWFSHLARVL
jgi:hypothetical protein